MRRPTVHVRALPQASVNDRIADLEAARLSCEADEDAALRLQEKLARLRATVALTRCGRFRVRVRVRVGDVERR